MGETTVGGGVLRRTHKSAPQKKESCIAAGSRKSSVKRTNGGRWGIIAKEASRSPMSVLTNL